MGGCSSKPQTAECEGRTPSNRELNLLLSGLKVIDPNNPSPYKSSQHTLQSLFIQHHRDGEVVLENAQTLQELLQDPKPLPNLDNESAGNAELASKGLHQQQEGEPSSPISVFTDLAQQDAKNFRQPEEVLLPLELAQKNEPMAAANSDGGSSKSAENPADEDAVALSVAAEQHTVDHALSEAADCKMHGVTSQPKDDLLLCHEPNLSRSVPADQVHEIKASEAMEIAVANIRALDAEAVEGGIDRHEQEFKGVQKTGKMEAESKIEDIIEEHAMEGAVEAKMQAETELEEAEKVMGALNPTVQHNEATKAMECEASLALEITEPLMLRHEENSAKSCLQSEKAVLQETEEKAIEGEKTGVQAESILEAEKIGVQDRESIESEKAGGQNEEDMEHEKGRTFHREGEVDDKTGIVQEGKQEELQGEEKACIQDAVTTVHVDHAGVPDGSAKEETTCVKEVVTVQDFENEDVQDGLQSKVEQNLPADDNANKNYGELENERATANELPSHVDSKAGMENIDEPVSCEVSEQLKSDRGMLQPNENTVKQADLGLTEKLALDENLATSGRAIRAGTNQNVIDKFESEEKKTEKSLEHESSRVTILEGVFSKEVLPVERGEMFEHKQQTHDTPVEVELDKKVHELALELSSSEDKKADNALSKQKLLERNATDKLESSKIEPTIELEHERSNVVDSNGKQEESFEVAHNGQSDINQSSVNLESIHSRQIEKPSNGLDLNRPIGVEAGRSLQMDEKDSLPN